MPSTEARNGWRGECFLPRLKKGSPLCRAEHCSAADCRQTYAAKLGHAWGDCEGGGYAPLHVQSMPKWELFRKFPFWLFKLSTLCRQLEAREDSFFPGFPGRALRLGAVLLPDLLDALGLGLVGGIPAAALHGGIYAVLHADGVVQRGAEGLVDLGRGGFHGTVQIQVAYALGGEEDALHDLLVVHKLLLIPD